MESSIQNKLSNYEPVPPDVVWNRIAAALDENEEHLFSERILTFTTPPPSGTWEKISRILDVNKVPAVVLPFYKKYRRPLKYTGAAAAIAFFAILTSLLISKKTISEVPLQPSIVAKEALKTNTPGERSQEDADENSRSNTQSFASAIRTPADRIKKTNLLGIQSQSTGSLALLDNILPKTVQRKNSITSDSRTEQYMIYSDEEGNAVRLPKKLFDAFACPVEQVSCKQKLKRIQEKIAASAQSADFTGILEIVKTLQENQ
jgi:hypothetical protein